MQATNHTSEGFIAGLKPRNVPNSVNLGCYVWRRCGRFHCNAMNRNKNQQIEQTTRINITRGIGSPAKGLVSSKNIFKKQNKSVVRKFLNLTLSCNLECQNIIFQYFINRDGSRIPWRRGRRPSGGAPTYDFVKFSEKLHEIEKILGRRGAPPPQICHW